jgi:hypothetical protein
MPSNELEEISDLPSHDAAIALASSACLVILFVVADGNRLCDTTTAKVQDLATRYGTLAAASSRAGVGAIDGPSVMQKDVRVFRLPLTAKTTPFIKFGIQNAPLFICLREGWCETLLGAEDRTMQKLERIIQQHMDSRQH